MAQRLILHIGAHRTASTSTQESLEKLAENRALGDLTYIPPASMRREFAVALRKLTVMPVLGRAAPLQRLAPDLAVALRSDKSVLLSEESLLGSVDPALRTNGGLYPEARARLRTFSHLIRRRKARIVLVIRDYADWYSSAYAMASVRRDLPPIEELSPSWAHATRGWRAVADDAIESFGSCEIIQFECLKQDPKAVLRALVGSAAERAPLPHRQRSMSRDALQQVIAARHTGKPLHLTVLNKLREESADGKDPVRIAPAQEKELRRRYQGDINEMRAAGYRFISGPL